MPPKKPPTASQKAALAPLNAAPPTSRTPLPTPLLPASDSVAPLWTPHTTPHELFPEWPTAAALAAESWCTADAPFEDTDELVYEIASDVTWKRPSQFLPVIVDPTTTPVVPAAPEPKAPLAKKTAVPAAKKMTTAEQEKKAPKHAHVFYVDPHHDHMGTRGALHLAGSASASSHGSGTTLHPGGNNMPTSSHPVGTGDLASHHKIPRNFRRLWSADEIDELAKWRLEEARIERERQHRERVYMGFEDAIAYIVNERPRGFDAEEDVDADDLVDDEQDEDEDSSVTGDALSNDSSPWGVIPPPRIEIAPNTVSKPEIPHGDVVHGDMAALFHIVEQLFDRWEGSDDNNSGAPFLWHAIYPQNASGVPIYNPGGKYSVKLFVLGKWRRIDIDDRLPVDAKGNILYLTSSMKSEIWPALLTKALLKVVHWLFGFDKPDKSELNSRTRAVRFVNAVVSALTGWKVTHWQPKSSETALGDSQLIQQLLEFIPGEHLEDDSVDGSADAGEQQNDADGGIGTSSLLPTSTTTVKPRALVCCTSERGTSMLCPGEAALVTDIVGDSDNLAVKFSGLKGTGSVPEEMIASERLEFLLVHPPFSHSDLLVQQWTATKTETAGVEDPTRAPVVRWTPFSNPATQLVLIRMPRSTQEQSPSDAPSEAGDPHHQQLSRATVEVVFTLTRIQPSDSSAQAQDTRLRSAIEMAKYVPNMDPQGSVVLSQEITKRQTGFSSASTTHGSALPLATIPPLSTTTSTRVLLPVGTGEEDIVFRVHPQQSLCYGYGLQVEANVKVDFQEPSTYWRNVQGLHVVDSDGEYRVMLADTWNVLFKHNIELAPPPEASASPDSSASKPQQFVDLHVDLRVSDAMLVPFVHIMIVDDETSAMTRLSSLCTVVSIPINDAAAPHPFTVIVDCAPQGHDVPEGKWHLALGSSWTFKASSPHPMKLTAFEDLYVANKPLLLFRDVLVAPKKSIWTSFQLKLLPNSNSNDDEELVEALAVKLEVIDAVSEQLISEAFAMRDVRLMQLPRHSHLEDKIEDDGKNSSKSSSGYYIIQGSIDKARCVVPETLRSVRPFRNRSHSKENDIVEESGNVGEDANATLTSIPSASLTSNIKWRLNCWCTEDVKLDVDRAKETRFEAIRSAWAEAARDRHTSAHGTVSRLLYLGKTDAAEAKIRLDGVPEELATRIKARFQWIDAATVAGQQAGGGKYLERRIRNASSPDTHEKIKTLEEFQEEERVLNEEIDAVQRQLAQKREERVASKEQRAQEIKDLVQLIREQRSTAIKARSELWRQRNSILLHPQSSA